MGPSEPTIFCALHCAQLGAVFDKEQNGMGEAKLTYKQKGQSVDN